VPYRIDIGTSQSLQDHKLLGGTRGTIMSSFVPTIRWGPFLIPVPIGQLAAAPFDFGFPYNVVGFFWQGEYVALALASTPHSEWTANDNVIFREPYGNVHVNAG
jgi:hypothetical protein